MDSRIKEIWIDRLENGDIRQVGGSLGNADGSRCCLGVLCDIAVEENVIGAPSVSDDRLIYGNQIAVLPQSVQDWAGLDSPNGGYKLNTQNDMSDGALSFDNDCGKSFQEIANTIRERF